MNWDKVVTILGVHAEGEVGRVITGGILDVPGATMIEKLAWLQTNDELRQFVNQEPRGAAQMTTNLLLPALDPQADAAFIPMQADATHPMSGSNAMCVTTALLETGIVEMSEPETIVTLETAAGLITAIAQCCDGKVERVALDFFPAYSEHLDTIIEVDGIGSLCVDVAFGGVFYALVKSQDCGFRISTDTARDMVDFGTRIKAAAKAQLTVQHPLVSAFNEIDFVMFTDVVDREAMIFKNATIMPPGRVDRSPCGTGTAARLAVMHAKGEVKIGDRLEMRSAIDSCFEVQVRAETTLAGRPAILPRISGRSWIYATMQLGRDPTDPYPNGYTLSDTWGPDA